MVPKMKALKVKTNLMKRNSTSSMGALHPLLFMLMIYILSIMLAIFVCTTIYNSLNASSSLVHKDGVKLESLAALK
jgi:hypothetical protein